MTDKTPKQLLWDWLKSENRANNQRVTDTQTYPNRAAQRAARNAK